jgi:hypothetical protein
MTTETVKTIKAGDTLKLNDGTEVIIKRHIRKSKFYHGAMIYETTDRRMIALTQTLET